MSGAISPSITIHFWHKSESHEKKLLHVALECHRQDKESTYVSFRNGPCRFHPHTQAHFHMDMRDDALMGATRKSYSLRMLDVEKVVQAFHTFKENMDVWGVLGYGILLPSFPKTPIGVVVFLLEKGGLFNLVPDPRKTVLSTSLKVCIALSAASAFTGFMIYRQFPTEDVQLVDMGYGSTARGVAGFEWESAPLLTTGIEVLTAPMPANDPLFQRGQGLISRLNLSARSAKVLREEYFYDSLSPVGLNKGNSYNLSGFMAQKRGHIFRQSIIGSIMTVGCIGFYYLNNRYLTGHFSGHDLTTSVIDAVEKEEWLASQPQVKKSAILTKKVVVVGGFFIAGLAGLGLKWWNRKS